MNIYGFKVHELISVVVLLCLPCIIAQDWFFYLFSILVYGYAGFYIYKKVNKKVIDVKGRGVFITGCDTGFGFGLAKVLDDMGFTVFAGCLLGDSDGAQTLRSSTTGRMHVIQLDVTKDKSVEDALKFVKKTISETKCGFWAIVNNAGIQVYGEVEFLSMDVYHKVAEVNLFGLVRCTKVFLPLIRQNKGRIINVTSVQGRIGLPFQAVYAITKYGGEAFSDILRLEMRKFGVKVIIVEPGNFAGITGILSPENLARPKKQIDAMWDAADAEVQTTYGKDYYDALYKAVEECRPDGYPTLDPANEAFTDGLTNENPQYRYLVDGAKAMVDNVCILARLNSYLPTYVMDILRERFFLGHMPKISALQK